MVIRLMSKTYGEKYCLIDNEDWPKVGHLCWCIVPNRSTFYAMSRLKIGHKKYKTVRMHQLLIDGKPIDHRDGNGLNNQKSNLRKATTQQNNCNSGLTKRNKSGYKGVHWERQSKRYVANIRIKGKLIVGGRFKDPKDAAKKYNELAVIHHGEFAWLNPI